MITKLDHYTYNCYLELADANTFAFTASDFSAQLALSIGKLGLTNIYLAQKTIGLQPEGRLIVGPDASPSRNKSRFEAGFFTGGKYIWGKSNIDLIPLGFFCNSCGYCVAGLEKIPPIDSITKTLFKVKNHSLKIDNIKIKFDYAKSNHFIQIFKVDTCNKAYAYNYIAVIHGSSPELFSSSPFNIGLNLNKSQELQTISESIITPTGHFYFVSGNNAVRYFKLTWIPMLVY